jgi:hypothetical protein
VNSNMHDTFDLREGYLLLQHKQLQLFAGRQELKFGSERLVGVSDFTNNSRTFDGFDMRVGDKNRIDFFSSSVVTTPPASLDKHGAGLTFHGAYGQISTWIPNTNLQPFILIKALPSVKGSQNTSGPELETTFGTEVEGTLPAGFDYDALGAIQRGSRGNNSIQASAGLSNSHISPNDCRGPPESAANTIKRAASPQNRTSIAPLISSIRATTTHSASAIFSAFRTSARLGST